MPRQPPRSPAGQGIGLLLVAMLGGALLLGPVALADSEQDRRNEAGLHLFSTLLAADVDLQKKTSPDGKLLLVIFYTSDARSAETLAKRLRVLPSGEARKLGGREVAVEITSDAAFHAYGARQPAGIFLAQAPPAPTLSSIVQYGIGRRILVYSPFEGHVERGVAGGLIIGAQVKPYVNAATLAASQISLKPLVMKVVKVYR
jgi:hypothetical protein